MNRGLRPLRIPAARKDLVIAAMAVKDSQRSAAPIPL